nr:hypothetical protein [Streptomyces sp. DSM 41633]
MPNGPEPRQYTGWEKTQIALLIAESVKRGAGAIDARLERVKARAVERERVEDAARAKVAADREKARFEAAVEKAARKYRR